MHAALSHRNEEVNFQLFRLQLIKGDILIDRKVEQASSQESEIHAAN